MIRKRRASDRDWVGLWYEIARDERGVNDQMSFLRVNLREGATELREISHARMDGLGAIVHLLRHEGHAVTKVPVGRETSPPPAWKWPSIVAALAKLSKAPRAAWLNWDESKQAKRGDIAWHVFTPEETRALHAHAKGRGVSVNSLMMSHLGAVLAPKLVKPGTVFPWLFPVNLRGAVAAGTSELSNHSSAVGIEARADSSAEELHGKIRDRLRSGVHWALWATLHSGKVIGLRGMRFLSNHRAGKNYWMGTFSNLGRWPAEGAVDAGDPNTVWIPGPPATINFPVAFACVEWFGRLAYSLKIHPGVCPDGICEVKRLSQEFTSRLRAYAPLDPRNTKTMKTEPASFAI